MNLNQTGKNPIQGTDHFSRQSVWRLIPQIFYMTIFIGKSLDNSSIVSSHNVCMYIMIEANRSTNGRRRMSSAVSKRHMSSLEKNFPVSFQMCDWIHPNVNIQSNIQSICYSMKAYLTQCWVKRYFNFILDHTCNFASEMFYLLENISKIVFKDDILFDQY